jgi:hypothetical protein
MGLEEEFDNLGATTFKTPRVSKRETQLLSF